MSNTATVRLGERIFPVVPQRHARLRHYLNGADFSKIMSGQYAGESYRLLCILIPAMDPKRPENNGQGILPWEWDGFSDEDSWRRYHEGDETAYDEYNDPSPTGDEIVAAFDTVLQVNGAHRLGKLVELLMAGLKVASDTSTGVLPALPGAKGVFHPIPIGAPRRTSG